MIVDPMRVFVTVIEQKNFTRAAEILNISQPNVSLHIRNLENELGMKLIHRSPKYVKITEAGEILYRHAKKILQTYEEAIQEINDLRHVVTGHLRIGASFTVGEYLLPRVLADYAAQFPLVDVEIIISNTEEVISSIQANELDIGLIEGEASHSELQIEAFMEDEMFVVVPPNHPLSQGFFIAPDLMQNQTWIFREPGSGTRTFMDKLISTLHLSIKNSYVFNSNQGVLEAVKAGLGIALLSHWVVDDEITTNKVKALSLKNHKIKRTFSTVQKMEAEETKAKKMFIQKLLHFCMNI